MNLLWSVVIVRKNFILQKQNTKVNKMMLNLTKEEVTNIIRIYVENNFDVYKIKLIRGTDYSNIPEVTVELEDVK